MKFFMPYTALPNSSLVWETLGEIPPFHGRCGEIFGSMSDIKTAGYDGVEIFLNGEVRERPMEFAHKAAVEGLDAHYHILWSAENSPHTLHSRPLSWCGYLLPNGYTIADAVPRRIEEPVVINGDLWRESTDRSNYWLQTYGQIGSNGKFIISYKEFLVAVRKYKLPVVFDTEHVLEFKCGVYGPKNLPHNRAELLRLLKEAWDELGEFVKEIHFNDCDPVLNRTKVFLGSGMLELEYFAELLKRANWDGSVVTEVMPAYLNGSEEKSLSALLKRAKQYLW